MEYQEQTQNEVLLAISNEIVRIRGKEDMLRLIRSSLKQYIDFDDSFILRYYKPTKTCKAYIFHVEKERMDNPDFKNQLDRDYFINDDSVTDLESPVVEDVEQLLSGGNNNVSFIYKTGIREIVITKLVEGNRLIGLFVLLSQKKHTFTPEVLSLLKKISHQISIATANIIANEEIAKREEEKTVLLSLSNEIAALKNREDLLHVVPEIKKLFSIEEFILIQIDEDGQTYSAFVLDIGSQKRSHSDYNKIISAKYNVSDPVFALILNSEDAVVFETDKMSISPDMPPYVAYWKSVGIKKIVFIALRVGGKPIGSAGFLIDTNPAFDVKSNLIKGVSAQLSVAMSNIIAHEKILAREEEKTRLLEFSNALASVRDKQVLAKILRQQLKELFGIEDYVIHCLSKDKKTHRPLLYDPDADFAQHPDFIKLLDTDTSVEDGVFNTILASDDLVTFNVEDWFHSSQPPTYSNAAKAVGLRKMASISIRLGQENIAVMNFRRDGINDFAIQRPLFKSICSQLAIAISHIMADEEIIGREEEKSKLLAFSNQIASAREKDSFSKKLKQQLNSLFGIEDYVIHELSENKQQYRPILYDPTSEFARHPDFIRTLHSTIDIKDGQFDRILASTDPVELKLMQTSVFANVNKDLGLKTVIGVPLRLGQESIAMLIFTPVSSKYFLGQKQLFKSICSQLAIAVFNFMANEKITRQLAEIDRYRQQLEEEKIYLKEEIETSHNYSEIIGKSQAIKKVFHLINQVAPSDSTVLLLGETGTGKELIARAIHHASPRKGKLMIKINCAALPPNLIESELFGHEKGSFTGAIERRIGKFELAHQSTLFLDEIGEMPLELQVKLLRALQEKEIERVGGKASIKTDVRIIAATNRDLEKLVEEGKFRIDLYYRLNIFPISLPALRERREDIPLLASHFIDRFAKKAGRKINNLSNRALQELMQYHWPGNIRELEHLIERSILLSSGETIKDIHLPVQKQGKIANNPIGNEEIVLKTIDENEREHILKILKYCKGKISGNGGAAQFLGVPPSTLNSRMKRLGIEREFTARARDK